jgi:hypothetical protein
MAAFPAPSLCPSSSMLKKSAQISIKAPLKLTFPNPWRLNPESRRIYKKGSQNKQQQNSG